MNATGTNWPLILTWLVAHWAIRLWRKLGASKLEGRAREGGRKQAREEVAGSCTTGRKLN